MFKKF